MERGVLAYKLNRAWAEINLDHIAHNIKEVKRLVGEKTEIMAVVKADAYGHGIVETVPTLLKNGASRLAVSMLDEAIQLRKLGIEVPILVLSYTDPKRASEIVEYNITQTVFSHDLAMALSDAAVKSGKSAKIHVKIDTGMTRVGFMPGYSAVKNIMKISELPSVIIEGLFTHFAAADEVDVSYTLMQYERYESIWQELNRIGIYIPVKHVSNSAAVIQYPDMHLNLVRPGIILYGLYPSPEVDKSKIDLKPAMTLKANIILIKDVEENTDISYGRTFTTASKSRIATIPIGYADGYSRLLSNKGKVLVNGQFAPIVGRICMDQCMIDVTKIEGPINIGDEVVIIGTQGNKSITADEIAGIIGTINYEVVCLVGKRIPRVYIKGGNIQNIVNYLVN